LKSGKIKVPSGNPPSESTGIQEVSLYSLHG
jgi:hypothetical protein